MDSAAKNRRPTAPLGAGEASTLTLRTATFPPLVPARAKVSVPEAKRALVPLYLSLIRFFSLSACVRACVCFKLCCSLAPRRCYSAAAERERKKKDKRENLQPLPSCALSAQRVAVVAWRRWWRDCHATSHESVVRLSSRH